MAATHAPVRTSENKMTPRVAPGQSSSRGGAAVPRGGESGGGSGMAGVGGGGGGTGGVEDGATSGLRYPPPPGRGDFFPGPAHGEARPRVAYRPY